MTIIMTLSLSISFSVYLPAGLPYSINYGDKGFLMLPKKAQSIIDIHLPPPLATLPTITSLFIYPPIPTSNPPNFTISPQPPISTEPLKLWQALLLVSKILFTNLLITLMLMKLLWFKFVLSTFLWTRNMVTNKTWR